MLDLLNSRSTANLFESKKSFKSRNQLTGLSSLTPSHQQQQSGNYKYTVSDQYHDCKTNHMFIIPTEQTQLSKVNNYMTSSQPQLLSLSSSTGLWFQVNEDIESLPIGAQITDSSIMMTHNSISNIDKCSALQTSDCSNEFYAFMNFSSCEQQQNNNNTHTLIITIIHIQVQLIDC